jgi:MerR family transcriptional regulator, light-induced transcriptional regulator
VARLEVPRLQQMLGAAQEAAGASQAAAGPRRVTCAVVGAALAARVSAPEWRRRHLPEGVDVRQVSTGLEALLASPAQAVELLLVRVNAVHRSMQDQLLRALELWQAPRAILLYNYGAAPALEALQRAGVLLRREPLADADLAHLVRSGLVVDAARSLAPATPGATIPPRRYSDEELAVVATSPSSVMCECPRHIAELITQLAGLEAYSQQCLNATDDDAQLHAYLRSVAGSARALFEQALEMAARHGGLQLPQR